MSPSNKNSMKSYLTFIWDESFLVYRDFTCWRAPSLYMGIYLCRMNAIYSILSCLVGKLSTWTEQNCLVSRNVFLLWTRITFSHMKRSLVYIFCCLLWNSKEENSYYSWFLEKYLTRFLQIQKETVRKLAVAFKVTQVEANQCWTTVPCN